MTYLRSACTVAYNMNLHMLTFILWGDKLVIHTFAVQILKFNSNRAHSTHRGSGGVEGGGVCFVATKPPASLWPLAMWPPRPGRISDHNQHKSLIHTNTHTTHSLIPAVATLRKNPTWDIGDKFRPGDLWLRNRQWPVMGQTISRWLRAAVGTSPKDKHLNSR